MSQKAEHSAGPSGNSPGLPKFVSLKTIAKTLDVHRTTVRRWLKDAGIQPIGFGDGMRGAIRYESTEIAAWIQSKERVR